MTEIGVLGIHGSPVLNLAVLGYALEHVLVFIHRRPMEVKIAQEEVMIKTPAIRNHVQWTAIGRCGRLGLRAPKVVDLVQ